MSTASGIVQQGKSIAPGIHCVNISPFFDEKLYQVLQKRTNRKQGIYQQCMLADYSYLVAPPARDLNECFPQI